jgi:hypothetical protein
MKFFLNSSYRVFFQKIEVENIYIILGAIIIYVKWKNNVPLFIMDERNVNFPIFSALCESFG